MVIAGLVFLSGDTKAKTVLLATTVMLVVAMTIEYLRYRAVAAETTSRS